MATVVNRYIGSNGEVLFPIESTAENTSSLISTKGVYYLAQTSGSVALVTGNPIGLLLSLTYTL